MAQDPSCSCKLGAPIFVDKFHYTAKMETLLAEKNDYYLKHTHKMFDNYILCPKNYESVSYKTVNFCKYNFIDIHTLMKIDLVKKIFSACNIISI